MAGLFQSLDVARRAIWASRLGMDVTSHNIANVNTPGYSRQRVENKTVDPLQLPEGQLGLGVTTDSIERIRNGLLDNRLRQSAHSLGNATIKEQLYSQVESIFQAPSENGIGNLMTEFFTEFSHLASEPENMAIRNSLRQKAITLVDSFHQRTSQLDALRHSARNDTETTVKQINELTQQIAKLNRKITTAETGVGTANDLRDRRDLMLDRLAEYVKIGFSENETGQVSVYAEGMTLVSGTENNQLSYKTASENGKLQIQILSENGNTHQLRYGKLGALMEMHNQELPALQTKLDTLAQNLAAETNKIHSAGQGLPVGDPPTSSTGIQFFTGDTAGTLDISTEIRDDVTNIAASTDGTPGNGENASAISNLRTYELLNGQTQTLNDFYVTMISDLGIDIQRTQNTRSNQELLTNQIQNQREQISGVSLDEEMTNLIKYQRTFEAAAKVVGAVDEIMKTVINMV